MPTSPRPDPKPIKVEDKEKDSLFSTESADGKQTKNLKLKENFIQIKWSLKFLPLKYHLPTLGKL